MSARKLQRLTTFLAVAAAGFIFSLYYLKSVDLFSDLAPRKISWGKIPHRWPAGDPRPLPRGSPRVIPRIQYDFPPESIAHREERLRRQSAVKAAFEHSWKGYRKNAWLKDEILPVSGGYRTTFGGWGATLVDSLDTLCIMGMKKDFDMAAAALRRVDFTRPLVDNLNVFEMTIRYLGGLLGAYDLCGCSQPTLLEKAVDLADMLFAAFDTPNRMPVTHWRWTDFAENLPQEAARSAISSELGSLTLEFTRLSQLTGDPKYFGAVERVMDEFEGQQNLTRAPGLWPVMLNAKETRFTDHSSFTWGGMSDSLYEYLPKQYLLLGGLSERYRYMYQAAVEAAKTFLLFKPMLPTSEDLLVLGSCRIVGKGASFLDGVGQHLTCFAGGMLAMGAKIFERPEDLKLGQQITDGCVWAYNSTATGIMPELFRLIPCPDIGGCEWSEEHWYHKVSTTIVGPVGNKSDIVRGKDHVQREGLKPGFTEISDARYMLRPEAIESLFILYRVTGDSAWQDKAWTMFQAIENATRARFGYSGILDVNFQDAAEAERLDSCESFWTAETLKYFYLIFSEPDLVSLDEYVLNTEAHTLKRPVSLT